MTELAQISLIHDNNVLKKIKEIKDREDAFEELIFAWLDLMWEQIMSPGEREIWKKAPLSFKTTGCVSPFNGKDALLNTHQDPRLIISLTKEEIKAEDEVWLVKRLSYGLDPLSHSYTPLPYEIYQETSQEIPEPIQKFVITYDRGYAYEGKHPNIGNCWRKLENYEEHKEIEFPQFEENIIISKGILEEHPWLEYKKKERIYLDKNSETTKRLVEKVIKYINLYRKEYRIRYNLCKFLETPGISPEKAKTYWPELFS